MFKLVIFLTIGLMCSLSAAEFAVVQNNHVDLINSEGKTKVRLNRGEVVKVRSHQTDSSFYFVQFGEKVYSAPKKSFRQVSSVFQEERRLLSQIDDTHKVIDDLNLQVNKMMESSAVLNKKISQLQIWIEVQRDLSYSKEFFIQKTRGSLNELDELKKQAGEKEKEIRELKQKLREENSKLKSFEQSFETLQTKLKILKDEKAFTDKKYVEAEVIADDAAVFYNGKVVEYLARNTTIKVTKDRKLAGWYIFFKNSRVHYISSSDVMINKS